MISIFNRRKSERVTDKERRHLAEKIRQENLQKEKEMLEQLKKDQEESSAVPPVPSPEKPKPTGRGGRRSAPTKQTAAVKSPAPSAPKPTAGKGGKGKKQVAVYWYTTLNKHPL